MVVLHDPKHEMSHIWLDGERREGKMVDPRQNIPCLQPNVSVHNAH